MLRALLLQLLDSHDLGAGRGEGGGDGDYRDVLRGLPQDTLVVGIDSDLLYPVRARHRPCAQLTACN